MDRAREYFIKDAKASAHFLDHALMIEENKERFGRSYDRATTWYALLNNKKVKNFSEDDYRICYYQWQVFNALRQMVEPGEDGSKDRLIIEGRYIDKTFAVMEKVYQIDSTDVVSEEDKIDYIQSCLSRFERQTVSETLHKASCNVLKMSFTDIMNYGNGYIFDSRKAGIGDMRWILTSEDGISRLLSEMGKEQVIINMNTQPLESSEEEGERLRVIKECIFRDGITDIATGKHYLCSAPSASSTRHCDFPFIVADSPNEVYDIWCEITGFTDIIDLAGNIGNRKDDGSIYVVFAKLKARIAQNGANSLSTGLTSTERIRNRLRSAKVVFVPDCKGTVATPYKKITERGVLSMEHPDGTVTTERV